MKKHTNTLASNTRTPFATVFHALSDPTRYRLYLTLALCHKPITPSELMAKTHMSQSVLSLKLRQLRNAGLVSFQKKGTHHYYSISTNGLLPIRQFLTQVRMSRRHAKIDYQHYFSRLAGV